MKYIILILALLTCSVGSSQSPGDQASVKASIDKFFQGFHQRDTAAMRTVLGPEVFMQRIGRDREGTPRMKSESIDDFLVSMAGLPDTLQIQERLLDYRIQIDGDMAHAWTPYEFYLEGKFHHCGVNSFQLFNDGDAWKIIYLVDTRRVKDCASKD